MITSLIASDHCSPRTSDDGAARGSDGAIRLSALLTLDCWGLVVAGGGWWGLVGLLRFTRCCVVGLLEGLAVS
jgi:hypothetical protein